VAGLREIEGHRSAHGAEPDESDLAGHCFLLKEAQRRTSSPLAAGMRSFAALRMTES
jgi:hypothetical protein